jgi:hypothetical protein
MPLGVLMLDTRFTRFVGDIGNPQSYDEPVLFEVVRGATVDKVVPARTPPLIDDFIAAGERLIARGADAITTGCGFLVLNHVERRAILAAVLDDLQWFYQQRILKRRALWKSASRLLTLGIICLAVVTLPFLGFLFGKLTGSHRLVELMEKFPNYGLFTVMSFGLLGAFFSRLVSFQFSNDMTVEAAENRYGFKSLAIRCGVGVCGAVIVYYLLQTGFIGTNYKPDFKNLGYGIEKVVTMLSGDERSVLLPSKDWCLLVLWSFLAGFSERLVPDTLARIDGELAGQKK